jgi:hypothetical protein
MDDERDRRALRAEVERLRKLVATIQAEKTALYMSVIRAMDSVQNTGDTGPVEPLKNPEPGSGLPMKKRKWR